MSSDRRGIPLLQGLAARKLGLSRARHARRLLRPRSPFPTSIHRRLPISSFPPVRYSTDGKVVLLALGSWRLRSVCRRHCSAGSRSFGGRRAHGCFGAQIILCPVPR
ncbi:hypothetical protein B0H12DRAFT_1143245 [Mycena haematopus]|nr:hypothetical protein B0H12DRAFT_1143245 [Mycena haematopus]